MTRTEKIIIVTGAGAVAVLFLLARRGLLDLPNPNNPNEIGGLPFRRQPVPKNNVFAGCKCADTQTTTPDVGDYSTGGYQTIDGETIAPLTEGY